MLTKVWIEEERHDREEGRVGLGFRIRLTSFQEDLDHTGALSKEPRFRGSRFKKSRATDPSRGHKLHPREDRASKQAARAATAAQMTMVRVSLLLLAVLVLPSLFVGNIADARRSRIVCYLHIDRNVNFLQLANTSGSGSFTGSLRGLVLPVTANESRGSAPLGYARGLSFQTSPLPDKNTGTGNDTGSGSSSSGALAREQLLETIEYDDGSLKGSIALHGEMSFPPASTDRMPIVGGTHAFTCAQGFGIPSLVNSPSSDSIVFRWELHLFYPTHCSSSHS